VLPAMIRGKLIGSKGVNIQDLREKTGAKIFVDNNAFQQHHAVRVIGVPDVILHVLHYFNEFMNEVADSEEFFQWIIHQPYGPPPGAQDTREPCGDFKRGDCNRGDRCRYSHDLGGQDTRELCGDFKRGDCNRGDRCRYSHDLGGQDRRRDPPRDRSPRRDRDREPPRDGGPRVPVRSHRSPPPGRARSPQRKTRDRQEEEDLSLHGNGSGNVVLREGLFRDPRFSSLEDIPLDAPALEALDATNRKLPAGAATMAHALSCELQSEVVQDVIDPETQRYIEEKTGTEIAMEDRDGGFLYISFTGPLFSTYLAHSILMMRVHEARLAKEKEEEEKEQARLADGASQDDVAELKAQVERLQAQLLKAEKRGRR